MLQTVLKLTGIAAAALILSACGGGSSEWGIDHGNALPKCSANPNDSSASILVPNGSTIKKVAPNTTIRVWHYANGEKQVCTITGEAVISGGK